MVYVAGVLLWSNDMVLSVICFPQKPCKDTTILFSNQMFQCVL